MSNERTYVLAGALALASLTMTTNADAMCGAPSHCLCDRVRGTVFAGDVVEVVDDTVRVLVDSVSSTPTEGLLDDPIAIGSELLLHWSELAPERIIGSTFDGSIEGATAHVGVNDEVVRACDVELAPDEAFDILAAGNCATAASEAGIAPPESQPCNDNPTTISGCAVGNLPSEGDDPIPLLMALAVSVVLRRRAQPSRARCRRSASSA